MDTKERILQAAQQEFVLNGFNGARMRAIANTAQVNKGLLHYHFGCKENLFEKVFVYVFRKSMQAFEEIIQLDGSLIESIERYVCLHIDKLLENPFIPIYILQETNRDPKKLVKLMGHEMGNSIMHKFEERIKKEVEAGTIKPIDSRQFVVSLMSMVVFPFLEQPLLETLFEMDKKAYRDFLEERKKFIPAFIKAALSLPDNALAT
jgi:AcrR family transcriptional regulator